MKWFKHDGNARGDEKIEKLLIKYGVEGYGLYFYCLEIIAGGLTSDNITFELKHDAETIAYRLKMDTLRVEEIMKWCVSNGLFQYNQATERIMCLGLGKRLDVTTSNNPEVRKIVANYQKLLDSNSNYQSLIAEENRIDKNRIEEKREETRPRKDVHESTGKPINKTRYQSLIALYGQETVDDYIQRVSDWCDSKGKSYKCYAAAAANWIKRDIAKGCFTSACDDVIIADTLMLGKKHPDEEE